MCESIQTALDAVLDWAWIEIFKVFTGAWTAVVATLALQNWRRQSRADRQTKFMDELTDSVHAFITLLAGPMQVVRFMKFGVSSYSDARDLDRSLKNPEAVAYIQKQGAEDAAQLRELLKSCAPVVSKIHSLVAKGQVLGLKGYRECQESCRLITWQYDRLEALCHIVGSRSLNWGNPKVQETLSAVLQLDPDEMKHELDSQNVKFLVFVKESYAAIYGS